MTGTRASQPALVLAALTAVLSACASSGDGGSGAPSGPAIEVVRSGGIAGVHDRLEIAPDGAARLTASGRRPRGCRPDPAAVARLRAADLDGLGPASVDSMPDGFVYTVRTGGRSVTVTEGETSGRRVALLHAAAAVIASCH